MKKKSWLWIFVMILLCIAVFLAFQLISGRSEAGEHLTNKEAKNIVQNRYQGSVTQIHLSKDLYNIKMEKERNTYLIKLDANTGEILSIEKIEGPKPHTALTETEIKNIVAQNTKGSISSINKEKEDGKVIYKVIVLEVNQQTTFKVDSVSGTILFTSTKKFTEPVNKLTESEAAQLAVKEVSGTVDEIMLDSHNGVPYYLVKVKTKNKQEAIVQIHAITGIPLSVTWDEHSKHDSSDD